MACYQTCRAAPPSRDILARVSGYADIFSLCIYLQNWLPAVNNLHVGAAGELPDSRSFGPFTPFAERWTGRVAQLGFAGLLLVELVKGNTPVF